MDFLGRAQTLVSIVESGSLSAAARQLGVSLAAVSRQIATLEDELGAVLLVRTTRKLSLTDAGRRFHDHAARLVREAEAARASVRWEGALGGTLVVAASVSFGALQIAPHLPAFLTAHPGLKLELRLEDRASDLVADGVDVAVRAGMDAPDSAGLVAVLLGTWPRRLVASPAYLRAHPAPRTVAQLTEHQTVVNSSVTTWSFEQGSVKIAPRLRVGTMIGLRAAVLAGAGLAVLPDFVVRDDLAAGTLRLVLPKAKLKPVAAHALYRVEVRGTPRIDAIVQHLRATLA